MVISARQVVTFAHPRQVTSASPRAAANWSVEILSNKHAPTVSSVAECGGVDDVFPAATDIRQGDALGITSLTSGFQRRPRASESR
jgi:hypothetical protein